MLKIFLKDSAVYAVPAFISRSISLFLIPFYTRILSPADYGSLDLLIVFSSIVNLTIALEVSQGLARFYSAETNPDRKVAYASSAFWLTVASYSIFTVIMLLLTPQVASFIMGQSSMETAFKIGLIYIWTNGLFYLVQNQFRWELRSYHFAIVSLMMSIITAGSSVWLAYFQNWGLHGLLAGMSIGCLTASVLGLWWLRTSFRFRFDAHRLKEMLTFSVPLVISGIAVWVSLYIDRLMINHFLSVHEVGLYSIGYRLASVGGLVMVCIQGSLTPLVYANYQNPETPRHLAKIFRLFLFFVLLIFLILTLFAKDILVVFTTPQFYGSSVVVIFLVPAILLGNMYIFSPGIGISKKTHLIVWINVVGGLMNTSLNYIFIPSMGITGAGLATMLSYFAIFCAYTVIGQRFYRIPHDWPKIGAGVILAGSVAILIPLFSFNDFTRWIFNLLILFTFIPLMIGIGLLRTDEISTVGRSIQARFFAPRD
jgi:O-antigen/teichoic acid export membrane protein